MKEIAYYESISDKSKFCFPLKSSYFLTKPHFHRSFEILYVTHGSTILEINNKKMKAEIGNILFIHQYQIHSLLPSPDYKMQGFIVGSQLSDSLSNLLQECTLPSILKDSQFNRTLLPYFERLVKTKKREQMIQQGFVTTILGYLLSHYNKIPIQKAVHTNLVINVLNYIDDHYAEPLTLTSISNYFGYNKCYFSDFFHKNTGRKLNDYINEIRLEKFVELATSATDSTMYDLVFNCGFESMTTFYRIFSKHYDISPKEFLKQQKIMSPFFKSL